jgi:hypothetical protein
MGTMESFAPGELSSLRINSRLSLSGTSVERRLRARGRAAAVLTRTQFEQLADVPPEDKWLANITNLKTRRANKEDVREFYRLYWLERLYGPPVGGPVAYHFLAQGHGKTRAGAVQATA